MSTVLVFGDSLSWGTRPGRGDRFPRMNRWPVLLDQELGKGYRVITEALPGRTTVYDTAGLPDRNGATFLPLLLETHAPLEVVVLMLGTNEMQFHRHLEARDAARGCLRLIRMIQTSKAGPAGSAPEVLLLAPPSIRQPASYTTLYFNAEPPAMEGIAEAYQTVAEHTGAAFLDAAQVVEPSKLDGVHLDAEAHVALAEAVAPQVRTLAARHAAAV